LDSEQEKVKNYFYRTAGTFDAIYSGRKAFWMRLLDQYFRPDMYERFRLTLKHIGDVQGKSVLDLGCGSGRYSVEFAKRGAKRVVGIDLAESMIRLAEAIAGEQKVNDVCEFHAGDFFAYPLEKEFDSCIALGVFDYMEEPMQLLEKMRSVCRDNLIASFPSYSVIRTPIRKLRYKFKKCPVYFYTRERIEQLLKQAGLKRYEIIKIKGAGMDFFVHAHV